MHFVMEQRMLRGIKERAEGTPLVPPAVATVAKAGWVLAGLVLLGGYLSRRAWQPWTIVPVVAVIPALDLTGDFNAALAGFLAVGITILGALAFGRRWWSPYALISAVVLLILLLAPDPYSAFGVVFLAIILGSAAGYLRFRTGQAMPMGLRMAPGRTS
jgi:hypothetical protein